jgi:hypothetical protein
MFFFFFQKNQNTKNKKKSKWTKGLKVKRKKLRDQIIFFVTWSPSFLGDQAIENNKLVCL